MSDKTSVQVHDHREIDRNMALRETTGPLQLMAVGNGSAMFRCSQCSAVWSHGRRFSGDLRCKACFEARLKSRNGTSGPDTPGSEASKNGDSEPLVDARAAILYVMLSDPGKRYTFHEIAEAVGLKADRCKAMLYSLSDAYLIDYEKSGQVQRFTLSPLMRDLAVCFEGRTFTPRDPGDQANAAPATKPPVEDLGPDDCPF